MSNAPKVRALDHLVLTVADISATVAFYQDALGMEARQFTVADGSQRWALCKINLHQAGKEFDPKALTPTPGSADLCFLTDQTPEIWQAHFAALNVVVEDGPVSRSGATQPITSLYVRDPDGNLIEVAAQNRSTSV